MKLNLGATVETLHLKKVGFMSICWPRMFDGQKRLEFIVKFVWVCSFIHSSSFSKYAMNFCVKLENYKLFNDRTSVSIIIKHPRFFNLRRIFCEILKYNIVDFYFIFILHASVVIFWRRLYVVFSATSLIFKVKENVQHD